MRSRGIRAKREVDRQRQKLILKQWCGKIERERDRGDQDYRKINEG